MEINNILEQDIYSRQVISEIKKWMPDKEMLLLLGARQTGKTSILYKIIQDIVSGGAAGAGDVFFFDAENINDAAMLSRGPEEIVKIVKPEKGARKYIFLDEIHYVKNIDRTIKVLVDHYGKKLKIIATGSSSLEIKNRFKESMAGRKIVFNVYPLWFGEYLAFTGKKELAEVARGGSLIKETGAAKEHMRLLASEYYGYMVYGGYPRVVLEPDTGKKKKLLEEIYTSYVRKDVSAFFRIEDIDKFNALINYTALNSGQLFNKNSASKELGIAAKTIDRYINVLKLTYIAGIVKPFHNNKTKEILKMPKIYFYDNGIRNAVTGNFADIESRADAGVMLETAAYLNLIRHAGGAGNIKFWRSKTGAEVDFVIDSGRIKAFECKKSAALFSASRYSAFIEKYRPGGFYVLNLDREEHGKIIFKPVYYI